MTSAWMTVPNFAKVRHYETDYVISGQIKLYIKFNQYFSAGGYWYNCCTDSNLNGVFYRHGMHTKNTDGITWYGWHGPNYSLKRVEMKIRPQSFTP